MARRRRSWVRPVCGAAILAVLVWRLGTTPFRDGFAMVGGWRLAAAVGIALLTTVCCAWRWSLVARGLGVGVPLRTAIAWYYRSQFLNVTLPGGVLGDVHRAVRHGHLVGDVGRSVRAVAWERVTGQVVQAVVAVAVLLLLPSPVRSVMPFVVAAVIAAVLALVLVSRVLPHGGTGLAARMVRVAATDVRDGVLPHRALTGIVLASSVVVTGHVVTFLLAARAAGSTASAVELLPLALLVLVAAGIPLNIAGWGPREGMAAWVFGATGLGAAHGVATAVVFGVMVLAGSLPGALVLVMAWLRDAGRDQVDPSQAAQPRAARRLEGTARG